MKKGDIVNCRFPFTDLSGSKRRPAMVLYEGAQDVLLAFISSNLAAKENFDVIIVPDAQNRLKKPSFVKVSKLATISKNLITGKIGEVSLNKIIEFNIALRTVLLLDSTS